MENLQPTDQRAGTVGEANPLPQLLQLRIIRALFVVTRRRSEHNSVVDATLENRNFLISLRVEIASYEYCTRR